MDKTLLITGTINQMMVKSKQNKNSIWEIYGSRKRFFHIIFGAHFHYTTVKNTFTVFAKLVIVMYFMIKGNNNKALYKFLLLHIREVYYYM